MSFWFPSAIAHDPLGRRGVDHVVRIFLQPLGEQFHGLQTPAHVRAEVNTIRIPLQKPIQRRKLLFKRSVGSVGVIPLPEKPRLGIADVRHHVIAELIGVIRHAAQVRMIKVRAEPPNRTRRIVKLNQPAPLGVKLIKPVHPIQNERLIHRAACREKSSSSPAPR